MARIFPDECRILIVEDEYVLAQQLKMVLEDHGVVVLGPAASEADARAILRQAGRPDGVVLDLNLGGELTFTLADELMDAGIPFLFATGYDESIIPPRYSHIPYAHKPVSGELVASALGCFSEPARNARN